MANSNEKTKEEKDNSDADHTASALNVQGFTEALKLKSCILFMQEYKVDILLLSETKSRQYYSYQSEQHLVILSGNNRDPNAGVGAIIAPHLRPHLADVVQVNPRLIHLTFRKKGGNLHIIGVYGPHSGLSLEEFREPFWERLNEHVSKIPQPEPVYIMGDFNVRFQAQHRNDQGVTGSYTYGKGHKFIDHSPDSNRQLCIRHMQPLNMLEVASYRTTTPTDHITYRDKTAPPPDWSQFVLDPLILPQCYQTFQDRLGGDLARQVALDVRGFLTVPPLLPALPPPPSPDPVR